MKELKDRVHFIHGTGFDDCSICDETINEESPGKRISYNKNDERFIIHVCRNCFLDPDFQETISHLPSIEVQKFNN
jgi:hypothetical protein